MRKPRRQLVVAWAVVAAAILWSAYGQGDYRDVLKTLAEACQKTGLEVH